MVRRGGKRTKIAVELFAQGREKKCEVGRVEEEMMLVRWWRKQSQAQIVALALARGLEGMGKRRGVGRQVLGRRGRMLVRHLHDHPEPG